MRFFGLDVSLSRKAEEISLDTLIKRLEAAYETIAGIPVTPESCMESPTVCGMVTAVTRRMETLPAHVYQKGESNGRETKERLPNHPVARLLSRPNEWQTTASYWLDSTSRLMRYGNFYAFKARGQTGPIRRLLPLDPAQTEPKQDDDWNVTYETIQKGGRKRELRPEEVHHVRLDARDCLKGDSPVMNVRNTIALEIAAERFGASFFGTGAVPGLIFKYAESFAGHKTTEDRRAFIEEFQRQYAGKGRFRALFLPKGIEQDTAVPIDNDKAQFLETRQFQRTIIAGAWNLPPHLVGDLTKGTFNNVEQQNLAFSQNVVLPVVRAFEAAMERDLLTAEDRAQGVIIRFNLEGSLRADFKTRQEGLKIQREMGVISPNEWRETEGMNPISEEDGGNNYWQQGPSGQSGVDPSTDDPAKDEEDDDEKA